MLELNGGTGYNRLVTVRSPSAYSKEESMKRRVMIIGGGASGMTAAIAAAREGADA